MLIVNYLYSLLLLRRRKLLIIFLLKIFIINKGNSGDDTQRAGALNLDGAQVVNIYDSIFKNIHVFSKGGCFQVNYYSKIRVENSRFESIYALDSGGIFNSGYDSRVEVKNCYCKYLFHILKKEFKWFKEINFLYTKYYSL